MRSRSALVLLGYLASFSVGTPATQHGSNTSLDVLMGKPLRAGTVHPGPADPGFAALGVWGEVPLGLEVTSDPIDVHPIAVSNGEKFSAVLERINRQFPDYHPIGADGAINIGPGDVIHDPSTFLNHHISHFQVANESLEQTLIRLKKQVDAEFAQQHAVLGGSDAAIIEKARALLARPVSVDLTNTSPRQVLNHLLVQLPEFVWVVRNGDSAANTSIAVLGFSGGSASFGR